MAAQFTTCHIQSIPTNISLQDPKCVELDGKLFQVLVHPENYEVPVVCWDMETKSWIILDIQNQDMLVEDGIRNFVPRPRSFHHLTDVVKKDGIHIMRSFANSTTANYTLDMNTLKWELTGIQGPGYTGELSVGNLTYKFIERSHAAEVTYEVWEGDRRIKNRTAIPCDLHSIENLFNIDGVPYIFAIDRERNGKYIIRILPDHKVERLNAVHYERDVMPIACSDGQHIIQLYCGPHLKLVFFDPAAKTATQLAINGVAHPAKMLALGYHNNQLHIMFRSFERSGLMPADALAVAIFDMQPDLQTLALVDLSKKVIDRRASKDEIEASLPTPLKSRFANIHKFARHRVYAEGEERRIMQILGGLRYV